LGRKKEICPQSAVIPFRISDGCMEILLITSRGGRRWIIPKGLVEPDMTPWDSAAKEALEEAGVTGRVFGDCLGEYSYEKTGMECLVKVYPLKINKILRSWLEDDYRKRLFVTLDEAVLLIEDKPLKKILRKIAAYRAAVND
jgi:8-oxo-dGTP pyrophosphatase MutT (NUDIX family)